MQSNIDTNLPTHLHILIVDDVDSIRDLVKGTLSSVGFRKLSSAKDGFDALHLLRGGEIDLVLCDWDMPNMNGMELLEKIRADKELADSPFIMLTGIGDVSEVKKAIAAGVDDYIVKPIQPKKLLTSVIQLIKRKNLI